MSPREKRSARDVALDALMQVDKANAGPMRPCAV